MSFLKKKVAALAEEFSDEIIAIRRHIHKNPELSFEEFKTSSFIAEKLKSYKIPFRDGFVKTGIVGLVEGKNPSQKVIALRADMDALPIQEENKTEYISRVDGVMHACGHDVHTACLLGASKILNELRNEFSGSVKLIFQPGEEKLPGGASLMINEGALKDPQPTVIFGQHVFPSLEAGKAGFRKGMYMASTDEIYLTVKGKGGHAAMSADYNNPILIASKILIDLQANFMENTMKKDLAIPTVLAFGKMTANGATNVIPAEVRIEGTFRTMNEKWREEAHSTIRNIAMKIAEAMNGTCEVDIQRGYPFLVNDDIVTERAKKSAEEYLGKENVIDLELRMTAEDFAWYSQLMPACFYRLGTANKTRGITSGVHTSTFDIDEAALKTGMGLMAWLALRELGAED